MAGLQGFASHGSSILSTGWLTTVKPLDITGTHLPLNPLVTDRKKALFDLFTLELDHSFAFNQFCRATSYFEAK